MRRFHLVRPEGVAGLELRSETPPPLAPGEVLVRLRAVTLNARDMLVMDGLLPNQKSDVVPLSDGAGEVLAVGAAVTRVRVGDRVVGAFRQAWTEGPLQASMKSSDLGGGRDGVLAEWVVLDDQGVVVIPAEVSYAEAASLPCAGVTAWRALMGVQPPRSGSTVLIHGTGGVALFALQLSRAAGATVLMTTSSEAKAERLRALGAHHIVDRTVEPDWASAVMRLTEGRGVDKIVETAGPGALGRSLACVALEGEIALVGLQDRPETLISPVPLLGRMASIRGVSVGSRRDLEALMLVCATGGLRPVIDGVFAFDDIRAAVARLQSQAHVGKIVISI